MLACLLCLSLCVSLFVFSVSAKTVSYPPSGFSFHSGKIYSDSSFTNELSLVNWQYNISASEYAVNLFSSSANIKSAILSIKPSSGNFFVLKAGEKVSFSICLRTYSNDSPNSYTASVSCILGGNLPLQLELHEDKQEVIGLSKRTYFSGTFVIPEGETLYCDFLQFKYSQSIATRFVEMALRECSINVYSDASMIVDGIGDKIDEQTEEQKNMFQRLLDGILNGLKSLFIPSDDFFQNYLSEMNQWLSDHFGALYYPIDLFIDVCGRLLNLEVPENPSITLPAFQVGETVLLPAQMYSFDMSALPALGEIHSFYLTVVDVIIALWLCGLAAVKLKSIMGG